MKISYYTVAALPLLSFLLPAYGVEVYNRDGNILDLNGVLKASQQISQTSSDSGDKSSNLQAGFTGMTTITPDLRGYGSWSYQYSLHNTEGSDAQNGNVTRLGYAGLKYKNLGSVDYGRNFGLVYDVMGYTDMLPYFGSDSDYNDVFLAGRSTGLLTWRNNNFFGLAEGLKIAAQYEGKNQRTGSSNEITRANGNGYALSASYDFSSGISLVGSYANLNRTSAQNTLQYGRGDKAQHWAAGIKYDANQIYLAADYDETANATPINGGFANKATNFEAVAQYQFINGLRPSIAYISSRGKDIENIGSADIVKYLSLGTYYYFNKNMSVFYEYKINFIKDDNPIGASSDNVMAAGIIYQF
ncbi:membrane protein [Tatumella morbirosei]|uniref:Membrane protein n=1 Tax=Tatumella morbirosei TaxID=642227 RepID=A0A095TDS6_9GAMM|nr:porin [Tatumella morbirosei]KGD74867.1 membrane protein [Tatumella morbirosei]